MLTDAVNEAGYPDPTKGLETSPDQASRGLMCVNPKNVGSFSINGFNGSDFTTYTVGSVASLAPFRSFPDVILKMTLVHEGTDGDGRGGYDEYGGSGGGYGGYGGSGGY